MAKILRVTRHSEMTSEQAEALQAAVTKLIGEVGPHTVVLYSETVKNAAEILAFAESTGATVVVVENMRRMSSMPFLQQLTDPRINTEEVVILMENEKIVGEATFPASFRPERTFSHYEKIVGVKVLTERV